MERAVMKLPRKEIDDIDRPLPGDERRVSTRSSRGRRAGESMRVGVVLKDAILYAAQLAGADNKGKDGLVGYLLRIAKKDEVTYAKLLSRVIPLQVNTETKTEVTFRSVEEIKADLHRRGIYLDRVYN